MQQQNTSQEAPQMLGHPKGLFYLFFAELWERFSFYGMRALLVLYMTQELFKELAAAEGDAAAKAKAFGVYASYGALVYATPAIGGMIADRLIGYRKAIMLGGVLMALGHFMMAFEQQIFFYGALGLLIVGNGFFKPNISTMVGSLYGEGDKRRDAGFTIFYMGINLGAFLAPLACGWLGEKFGYHYGFGAAGIGMLAGIVFFVFGQRSNVSMDNGLQPEKFRDKKVGPITMVEVIVYLGALLMVPVLALLVVNNDLHVAIPIIGGELMSFILIMVLIAVLIFLAITLFQVEKVERGRLVVVMILTFFITIFWSFFEQAGSSLTLFAEENVNLKFLNAAQTNAINPFYIIVFAIPFSWMWVKLSEKKMNPRTPIKFSLGIAQLGLGFLIFAFSATQMDAAGRVPFMYLILGYLLITTGELFISPIGLSKVTELSPAKIVAFMMGVYFLSSAFAHHISGAIAKLTIPEESTEYVEQSGIMNGFVEFATGTDQNAIGKFNFDNIGAFAAVSDTNLHFKAVNFKNKKTDEIVNLKGETFGEIDSKLKEAIKTAGVEAGDMEAQDTSYKFNEARFDLPSLAQTEKYASVLEQMKAVDENWTKAYEELSPKVSASFDKIKAANTFIQEDTTIGKEKLIQAYHDYNVEIQKKKASKDYARAFYFINTDTTKLEIAEKIELRKLQSGNPEALEQARDLNKMKAEMKGLNADWAENIFAYVDNVEECQAGVVNVQSLANYTKVFSQIALIAFFFAIFALALSPLLIRWMYGIH